MIYACADLSYASFFKSVMTNPCAVIKFGISNKPFVVCLSVMAHHQVCLDTKKNNFNLHHQHRRQCS
ncbi:unnamed protein product [Chironomus riparius]|uniref:Uncharacterized protein n=1 Tax=Chironomus riparius TaxID=315576 RepID=A0A9N9WRF5_9DIPT|nr:unnamed protein product [Chironomus riparius]